MLLATLSTVAAALVSSPGNRQTVGAHPAAEHELRNHTQQPKRNSRLFEVLDPTSANDEAARKLEEYDEHVLSNFPTDHPEVLAAIMDPETGDEVKEAAQQAINATSNAMGKMEQAAREVGQAAAKVIPAPRSGAQDTSGADEQLTPSEAAREAASQAGRIVWKGLSMSGAGDAEEGESQATE